MYNANSFISDIKIIANQITKKYDWIYGIPRGGVNVAIALSQETGIPLISDIGLAGKTLIVDDIIDSGKTRMMWPEFDFACLHIKSHADIFSALGKTYFVNKTNDWIHYFWENNESPAEDAVTRLIEMIGENPNREGLIETPKRVIKSLQFLCSGYKQDPEEIFKIFDSDGYDQIVLLKDIEMHSMCEHHILPFFGKAHVAYIPNGKVIGISKLARLIEIYSRRLQIQERICEQVTNDLMKYLNPVGAACIIEAQHLCMKARGVQKQNSIMTTSSLKGVFLKEPSARNELMGLIK